MFLRGYGGSALCAFASIEFGSFVFGVEVLGLDALSLRLSLTFTAYDVGSGFMLPYPL